MPQSDDHDHFNTFLRDNLWGCTCLPEQHLNQAQPQTIERRLVSIDKGIETNVRGL